MTQPGRLIVSNRIDGDSVELTLSMTDQSMRAVELLAGRAGQSPGQWIEAALSDCLTAGLEALPERIRDQGEGYGIGT